MSDPFRVFVASPGDVQSEREAVPRAVAEINETIAPLSGCRAEVVRWETDAVPAGGAPQDVINEQLGQYDVFVGVMWRRFGTPTRVAGSGTEEEFRIAYERWRANSQIALMFYFCHAPFYPASIEENDQMRRVLEFRRDLEGKALAWHYDSSADFEAAIRKHLSKQLPRMASDRKLGTAGKARPNDGAIQDLKLLWDRMAPDLQQAMSIAYNENRLAGDPGIQTRDLFAALLRVGAPTVKSITNEIPPDALPQPTKGPVSKEPYIIQERPWLSHCVATSVKRLGERLPEGRTLTGADVFADIAIHGTGESVALLRKHQIGPAEISAILDRKSIAVVT